MPVVAALASGTEAGRELGALLAQAEPLTDAQVLRATGLVEEAGGRNETESVADKALAAALSSLSDAQMPADVRAEFAGIAEFITARQW
jgi:geranylgeranyl diphosphate synthase type I